jgi:hypothetical protein
MAVINDLTANAIRETWGSAKGYPDWLAPFMLSYAVLPVLTRAARDVGMSYWDVKDYIKGHPDVDNFMKELTEFRNGEIEEMLHTRMALSDSLLQFALKSYMPERFGSKVDVTSDNKPLKTYVVVSPDDWDDDK